MLRCMNSVRAGMDSVDKELQQMLWKLGVRLQQITTGWSDV